ncbi:fructose-bisphosphate aldolase [Escherichia coli]|nr:fructose-bisphosphate aldolase [Escherichia coli]
MLVSMKELLQPTRQHGFAIGAFNVADNCFLRAVVDEAEATNTPAIIAIHPANMILWAMPFSLTFAKLPSVVRSRLYCTSIMVPL